MKNIEGPLLPKSDKGSDIIIAICYLATAMFLLAVTIILILDYNKHITNQ